MSKISAIDLVYAALKEKGISQAEASHRMNMVPQQLNARLKRGSLRADEFIEVLDVIGVEVVLMDKETGGEIHLPGYGRRVKMMVDHVVYDTSKSSALSNSFYADGVNEYNEDGKASELYVDRQGRYFFAEYSNWKDAKDRIVPANGEVAADFIKRYGTELNKKKK